MEIVISDIQVELLEKIENNTAVIGIIGLGYVGLPLALEFSLKNFKVIGFDLDPQKIRLLEQGKSYIKHINNQRIWQAVNDKSFIATTDFSILPATDVIIICVPTPLNEHREPDISYIENSGKMIARYLRQGQLVVLESSTYPGTTEEILLPMFEKCEKLNIKVESEKGHEFYNTSMKVGVDFFLAFSPEREDPNNPNFKTSTIPKVIGGVTPKCLEVAKALYDKIIVKTVSVSSTRTAEATKLLENIYRSVNIALVNELKMVFDRMGIDVWEVIEAASTKPFGYQPFYPGPGLGGHCIPIDPFYLTWKAREFDMNTKFIELAGEINTYQPYYVVEKSMEVLNKFKKAIYNAKVLILGAAYKKDVDDMRESPTLKLIEILEERGADVDYYDPYIPELPKTRKYNYCKQSIELTKENLKNYDLVILSTDHTNLDYKLIAENSKIIIDTRNAFNKNGNNSTKVFKA
jgi:UDP-N-acetyl-D-glucosamine dehydrogenase